MEMMYCGGYQGGRANERAGETRLLKEAYEIGKGCGVKESACFCSDGEGQWCCYLHIVCSDRKNVCSDDPLAN